MTKNTKLPCGLSKDGTLVYIDEAKNGLACECICPGCKQPLVAKNNGKKNEHHFAHKSKDFNCEHGYQSALHYMAKDCFLEMEYFTFKKGSKIVRYKIDSVLLETKVSEIIPDILVTCDGRPFIVEIFVTHAVDDEKKEKIKGLKISTVEINLSRFRHEMIDKETLKTELCKATNFSWLYDSDEDLIAEKKEVMQQFGMKFSISRSYLIECSLAMREIRMNPQVRYASVDFCKRCPFCLAEKNANFMRCSYETRLPVLLSFEEREKLYRNVIVNENKVLSVSEYNERMKRLGSIRFIPVRQGLYIFRIPYIDWP